MARKPGSTISNNPLDAVMGGGAKKAQTKPDPIPAASEAKERVTMYLPVALADRLRDAAWWGRSTLAAMAEEAFSEKLARIEKESGAIPKRTAELKTGRPVKR